MKLGNINSDEWRYYLSDLDTEDRDRELINVPNKDTINTCKKFIRYLYNNFDNKYLDKQLIISTKQHGSVQFYIGNKYVVTDFNIVDNKINIWIFPCSDFNYDLEWLDYGENTLDLIYKLVKKYVFENK